VRAFALCRAFALGVVEFRSDWATRWDDMGLLETYDTGRELAHRLTLRVWEH
jgi:hypothetical protein